MGTLTYTEQAFAGQTSTFDGHTEVEGDTVEVAPFEAAPFEYFVPVDPMDDLQCDSCQ
ncbi:hypothetical protein [Marisediminicola senii]|uniref:hypothetical protein n=1 Tax=Marisediminicola senii TaxID=2711233 RepID=UPI0013EB8E4C|nr:hypothetical protein [Marisediminicola senii]